jgi:hypothetical protein
VTPVHYMLCEPGRGEGGADRIRDIGSWAKLPPQPAAAAAAAAAARQDESAVGEAEHTAAGGGASSAEVVLLPAPLSPLRFPTHSALLPRRSEDLTHSAAAGRSC